MCVWRGSVFEGQVAVVAPAAAANAAAYVEVQQHIWRGILINSQGGTGVQDCTTAAAAASSHATMSDSALSPGDLPPCIPQHCLLPEHRQGHRLVDRCFLCYTVRYVLGRFPLPCNPG